MGLIKKFKMEKKTDKKKIYTCVCGDEVKYLQNYLNHIRDCLFYKLYSKESNEKIKDSEKKKKPKISGNMKIPKKTKKMVKEKRIREQEKLKESKKKNVRKKKFNC